MVLVLLLLLLLVVLAKAISLPKKGCRPIFFKKKGNPFSHPEAQKSSQNTVIWSVFGSYQEQNNAIYEVFLPWEPQNRMVEWDISTALPEKPADDGEYSVNLELLVKEQAEADTVKNGRIRKEVIVADASGERSSLILWDGHAKASLENDKKSSLSVCG